MKIEVWSDVVCPFCYIGKRKFEQALSQFSHKNDVEMIWKSYQLSPHNQTDVNINAIQNLANNKGMSFNQAKELTDQVTERAASVGLAYHFDKAFAVNTFNAHRFAHFAKHYGKQDEAEEVLFRSYFTDGKNIDDYSFLIQLGEEIGLDTALLKIALEDGSFADDVEKDFDEARQVGVRGVPFFVFNRKYAVSGAQEAIVFLETLTKAHSEWKMLYTEKSIEIIDGQSCTPEGECN